MSNGERDQDELIQDYLRNRLPDAAATAVEHRLETEQGQWREFERVLRMREGLAYLKVRGELTELPLLQPWYRRAPTLAAAAAIASVAVGAGLLLKYSNGSPSLSLSSSRGSAAGDLTRILLARTRGEAPSLVKPAAGMLEVRVRPEFSAAQYDLEMTLPILPGQASQRLTAPHLAPDADGTVTVYLSAADLPVGNYSVRIMPVGGSPQEASDFEFSITSGVTTN